MPNTRTRGAREALGSQRPMVALLKVSPDTLESAAKNVLPRGGDIAKLVESINPSVLSETAALGHDLQHYVVTDLSKWTNIAWKART